MSRRAAAVIAAFVTGALIAGGPPLAAAVFDADNADKVDDRHAVGSGASAAQRAGKLVAADASGRLPNAIIERAPNAKRLGGQPASAYQRRVAQACPAGKYITAVGAAGGVTCTTDRINGGDARFFDDFAPDDFERASATRRFVRLVGTALQNGTALRNAVTSIPPSGPTAPSATNRWSIELEPGSYDIGTTGLVIPDFVSISGAGRSTVISASTAGPLIEDHSVLYLNDDSSAERLRVVQSAGGSGVSVGLYIDGDRVLVSAVDVDVAASAAPGQFLSPHGVLANTGATPVVVADSNIAIIGTGTDTSPSVGVYLGANPGQTVRNSTVSVTVAAGQLGSETIGILAASNGAPTTIVGSEITVSSGGDYARALWSQNGQTIVDSSSLRASGSLSPASIYQEGAPGRIIRVVESLLDGPVQNTASLSCVGAFTESFAALNGTCG